MVSIPTFPKDVQMSLDAKEAIQHVPKLRNKIVRVCYEYMAEYTLYPTNAEYVQVAKALIVRYPFLRDMDGNGYHTWHMSLKRKFKAERAPLVSSSEVQKFKQKFGHRKQHPSPEQLNRVPDSNTTLCRKPTTHVLRDVCIGEDSTSVEALVNILQSEYRKTSPDISTVKDSMARTFAWRRQEIMDGMSVKDVLTKYPHLRIAARCFEEVDRIHPSTSSFCHRFREGMSGVLSNVLKLAEGKSPFMEAYSLVRRDSLAEDLPGVDLRAGLVFLPSIFREKIENCITTEKTATPYPIIQLKDSDWKTAFAGGGSYVVQVDRIDVCQAATLDEAFIAAFS